MYKILAKTLFLGKKVVFLPSCHSSNELASDMLKKSNPPEGTIIITNEQTKGKGQRGNTWETEPNKNLTFSIILKPSFLLASRQFDLSMMVSLGITDYLNQLGEGFKVKWPNDIYHEEKKLAGILIQNTIKKHSIDSVVVGIGLNVNQTLFEVSKASSLTNILGSTYELQEVLEGICHGIESRYLHLKSGKSLKQDYLTKMLGFQASRRFKSIHTFQGNIIDIDKDGRLVIKHNDGITAFNFKEVEFL